MDTPLVPLSKFLSLVLRHHPERIGLTLDKAGWVDVEILLAACAAHGRPMTSEQLYRVVTENDKQRFALSADRTRIRANQGHSVAVELDYAPAIPPDLLFHGTVANVLEGIRQHGLLKRSRQHVHLSASKEVALQVGARRGQPVILEVRAAAMASRGFQFFRSPNGVWLIDHVPSEYLSFP